MQENDKTLLEVRNKKASPRPSPKEREFPFSNRRNPNGSAKPTG
jgi:hypothetical protein